MDINLKFEEFLKKEKERLSKRKEELETKLEEIWKHALIKQTENEMIYRSDDLTDEDQRKNNVLEQRLNEASAKLAVFNYLINLWREYNEKTTTIPAELAEYSNVSISSDYTIKNKNDRTNTTYAFDICVNSSILYRRASMSFQNYIRLYEDSLKKHLTIIFLQSKGISTNSLSDEDILGYQLEYSLEITKTLALACSNMIQQDPQAIPTTK